MKNKKNIHFVGIKGVGMTPLAIIAKEAGFNVTGCDIADEFITDVSLKQAGIFPEIDFSSSHLINDKSKVDLVITTGAHGGFDNSEVATAKLNNIKVWTQGEALGEFMKGDIFGRKQVGISVTGCHGKTTTTAMLSTIFKENKLDPSFLIGTASIPSLAAPGHYGKGIYFIAEADEYATEPKYDKTPKFMWQNPKIAIFTNIELDHTDLYPTIDDIRNAYLKFANKIAGNNGLLIINGDNIECQKMLKNYKGKYITFGYGSENDYVLKNVHVTEQTFFWLEAKNSSLGEFVLSIPGEHNALNATASVIASIECGIKIDGIKKALLKFTGSKRRFEYIGKLESGALLYDDYAHHPTEIKKTLESFKKSFPKHKIICIFQPHTYSRTKYMFEQFIHSFSNANTVVLVNIYPSLREKADLTVSSGRLVEAMSKFHFGTVFTPSFTDVIKYIKQQQFDKNTVIVTMGAGDVYKIGEELIKK